jgi:hypothetical protein
LEDDQVTVTTIIHVSNEDPVLGDLDEMPDAKDKFLLVGNPSRREGKPVTLIADGVSTLIYPWSRVSYVEILGEGLDSARRESAAGFIRDRDHVG